MSAGQSGFANKLITTVLKVAPGVNPALVVATGATDLRKVFSPADFPHILEAYMDGLRVAFTIVIPLAGIALPIGLFSRWQNIKGKVGGSAA